MPTKKTSKKTPAKKSPRLPGASRKVVTMKISRAQVTFDREQDAVGIHMTLSEAKRIRAALGELEDEDLGTYGGILEILRKAIPQQFGR